jgi:hypothetical protein
MGKPLSNFQIHRVLKKDLYAQNIFKAVLPRDKLPSNVEYPSAYVFNTHTSEQEGEHWLAIYYDTNGIATFFDSFGLDPYYYKFDKFLKSTSKEWICNTTKLQSISAMTCGYYCIYFILLKSRNFTLPKLLELFNKKDYLQNDFKIVNIYP